MVGDTRLATDTKTDLVLSPTDYFNAHLRKRIKTIQRKKGFDVKALRVEDIDIKMIVDQRAVPDIVRQFDTIDAALLAVKKQIAKWWDLYPNKRQSYHVTLNYVQTNQSVMDPKGRQRPKQGSTHWTWVKYRSSARLFSVTKDAAWECRTGGPVILQSMSSFTPTALMNLHDDPSVHGL